MLHSDEPLEKFIIEQQHEVKAQIVKRLNPLANKGTEVKTFTEFRASIDKVELTTFVIFAGRKLRFDSRFGNLELANQTIDQIVNMIMAQYLECFVDWQEKNSRVISYD